MDDYLSWLSIGTIYLADAEGSKVKALNSCYMKHWNLCLQKTDFLECLPHFPPNHHVTLFDTSFYHCTHFLFSRLGRQTAYNAMKCKLRSLSFVLGKEVHRAHCTSASISTLTPERWLEPKFSKPEPNNKHRHCTNPRRCGLILRSLL